MRAPGSSAKASTRRLNSKVWIRILISSISIGCLAASGPHPDTKVFEFQTGPAPSITISNLRGQVTVRGWDKQSVRATCTVASPKVEGDAEPMPAEGPAERLQLST